MARCSSRRRATEPPATERATERTFVKIKVRDPKSVVLAYIHPGQVSSYFAESMIASLFYDQHAGRPPRIANR